jgi:hypothetical protein
VLQCECHVFVDEVGVDGDRSGRSGTGRGDHLGAGVCHVAGGPDARGGWFGRCRPPARSLCRGTRSRGCSRGRRRVARSPGGRTPPSGGRLDRPRAPRPPGGHRRRPVGSRCLLRSGCPERRAVGARQVRARSRA